MDLQRLWDIPLDREAEPLSAPLRPSRSRHPLVRLRRALRLNIAYGMAISAGMAAVLYRAEGLVLHSLFLVVLGFCLWTTVDTWRLLRSVSYNVSATLPALAELKRQHGAYAKWMRVQQRVGLFIYPVSAVAGGLWGGTVGSGLTVDALLVRPSFMLIVVPLGLALTPACAWLARWMFREAFGKQLGALRGHMEQMEGPV